MFARAKNTDVSYRSDNDSYIISMNQKDGNLIGKPISTYPNSDNVLRV